MSFVDWIIGNWNEIYLGSQRSFKTGYGHSTHQRRRDKRAAQWRQLIYGTIQGCGLHSEGRLCV